jgi:flagellar basal-body rod modification protein FlgD
MTGISYVSNNTQLVAGDTTTGSSSSDSNKSLSEEKQVFLSILLTQLENQNPLDPVDTTEFTNQLVAYSSLEQEMTMNDNLEKVISSLDNSNALSSVSYLGANVDVDTQASVMQDDQAQWSYALEKEAKNVTIQIVNSDKEVLAAYGAEESAAGTYDISVSNADLTSEVAEGTALYLVVVAVDADGETIKTDIVGSVTVDGVESSGDGVTLTAGSISFSVDDVVSLRMKAAGNA